MCDDLALKDGYKELYKQDQHICLQFKGLKFDKCGIPQQKQVPHDGRIKNDSRISNSKG